MANFNIVGERFNCNDALIKLDRFDQCVMNIHMAIGELKGGSDHIGKLRKNPATLCSFFDLISLKRHAIAKKKLEKEETSVSEHLQAVVKGAMLTIEHLDTVLVPWTAESTACLLDVQHWEFDKFVQEHINHRPQYHTHRNAAVGQLKYIEAHPNRLNHIRDSMGAIEMSVTKLLRELEFRSLSFRTLIASFALAD